MLTINEAVIKAAKDAVRFFRHCPDANAYVVHAKDERGCSDNDRIDLLFLRNLWRVKEGYSEPLTVYEQGGYRGAVICEKWIAKMVDDEDAAKAAPKEPTK